MSAGPDAAVQIERALVRQAAAADVTITVETAEARRWASATFTGARHALRIAGPASPALDRWLTELPEAEFALTGHLVADMIVKARRIAGTMVEVDIEALTVEER